MSFESNSSTGSLLVSTNQPVDVTSHLQFATSDDTRSMFPSNAANSCVINDLGDEEEGSLDVVCAAGTTPTMTRGGDAPESGSDTVDNSLIDLVQCDSQFPEGDTPSFGLTNNNTSSNSNCSSMSEPTTIVPIIQIEGEKEGGQAPEEDREKEETISNGTGEPADMNGYCNSSDLISEESDATLDLDLEDSNPSDSPQPQPDLLVDLAQRQFNSEEFNNSPEWITVGSLIETVNEDVSSMKKKYGSKNGSGDGEFEMDGTACITKQNGDSHDTPENESMTVSSGNVINRSELIARERREKMMVTKQKSSSITKSIEEASSSSMMTSSSMSTTSSSSSTMKMSSSTSSSSHQQQELSSLNNFSLESGFGTTGVMSNPQVKTKTKSKEVTTVSEKKAVSVTSGGKTMSQEESSTNVTEDRKRAKSAGGKTSSTSEQIKLNSNAARLECNGEVLVNQENAQVESSVSKSKNGASVTESFAIQDGRSGSGSSSKKKLSKASKELGSSVASSATSLASVDSNSTLASNNSSTSTITEQSKMKSASSFSTVTKSSKQMSRTSTSELKMVGGIVDDSSGVSINTISDTGSSTKDALMSKASSIDEDESVTTSSTKTSNKKKSTKKSISTEHISARKEEETHQSYNQSTELVREMKLNGTTTPKNGPAGDVSSVCVSKLKSIYATTDTIKVRNGDIVNSHGQNGSSKSHTNHLSSLAQFPNASALHGPSPGAAGEARVFAKVCVANLRKSFGELFETSTCNNQTNNRVLDNGTSGRLSNNNNNNNSLPCDDSTRRSRSSSGGDLTYNRPFSSNNQLYSVWQLFQQNAQELYDNNCNNNFGPSSFNNTLQFEKSSFSKFDQLSRIHVRSSDPAEIQAKIESNASSEYEQQTQQQQGVKIAEKICKSCGKQVFQMEMIKAEKANWHRTCFRCVECNKQLNVDTYCSHEGNLYCKPHFKELFQPKAVFDTDNQTSTVQSTEVIIRESQPVELPPDVVRASEKTANELEELQVDVKSRFQLFENLKNQENTKSPSPDFATQASNKRSASVLARMAKYESGTSTDKGVSDEDLANGHVMTNGEEESSGDENDVIRSEMRMKSKNPLAAMSEIMQCKKMDEVRSKWEEGSVSKKEELVEHRKEEMQKFRTRLCQGKSNQLKEMYEKAVENDAQEHVFKNNTEVEQLKVEKAKKFREMFEKGEVPRHVDDEEEETEEYSEARKLSLVEKEQAVFKSAVAKQSRNLFKELDQTAAKQGMTNGHIIPKTPEPGTRNKAPFFTQTSSSDDVVRSSDQVDDEYRPVNTEELSNRFNFFESYRDQEEAAKQKQRKTFRMTPPREGVVKGDRSPSPSDEVYRDPSVIRAEDHVDETDLIVQKSKTTSKMLNVFRQLEEQNYGEDNPEKVVPRPLKQFTPPREQGRPQHYSDEEEENVEEDLDNEEEDQDVLRERATEDEFLKEVGSMARARSLRAKFEKWEEEENEKNKNVGSHPPHSDYYQSLQENGESESIESAKSLRAKFELQQQLQQQKEAAATKREVRINRFVELQIQPGGGSVGAMSAKCDMCEKTVYVMEKVEAGGKSYHKTCFRCSHCKCILRMDTFTSNKGTLFCKNHFKQLFKIKGNYDEGFGYETQKQIWAKKQAEKENAAA